MRQLFITCFLVSCLGSAGTAIAQTIGDMLQQIRKVNTSKQISYRYAIYLADAATNSKTDSITGSLYKNGTSYIDSNSTSNVIFHDKYYCKLDHNRKVALVYDADILKKKLNMSLEDESGTTIVVPDSVILKNARSVVKTTADGNYRIQLFFSNQAVLKTEFLVDKNSYLVKEMDMEAYDIETGDKSQVRHYSIRDISYTVPAYRFNLDNYFSISKDKVSLNKRYTHYTLKTLINHS